MHTEHDVPLAPRTTLGIGGAAKRLVTVHDVAELGEALDDAASCGERVFVLGGGSNVVVGDAGWDGLVVTLGGRNVRVTREANGARIVASAGATWDDLVAEMVEGGYAGLECMSGIPGQVGATPIQNVGAYGQEVSDTLVRVTAFDRETRAVRTFTPAECAFGYRTSAFKGGSRYVVVEVAFMLPRTGESAPVRYAELARALAVPEGGRAPLSAVRETVLALRRGKGMVVDPNDPESKSAGSFFVNPILDADELRALEARAGEGLPKFPDGHGRTKVSAAWLIERAGFAKGYTVGSVGISRKHALSLVNRGGATAKELLALADEITLGVEAKFGVRLTKEPVVL